MSRIYTHTPAYVRKYSKNIATGTSTLEHGIYYKPISVQFFLLGVPQTIGWKIDPADPTNKITIENIGEAITAVDIIITYTM